MNSIASGFRSVHRLVGLSIVAITLLATPAVAGPNDDQLNEWMARIKARAQKAAEQIPPDWQKYIPRPNQIPGPSQIPDMGGIPSGKPLSAAALDRIMIGYQAGILKIVDGGRVVYVKRRPGSVMVAVDSVEYARVDDDQLHEIVRALGIDENDIEQAANGLMHDYERLPRTKVLAVLGVLAETPAEAMSPQCRQRVLGFLASRLRSESDVKVRRMAVLSLAIASETNQRVVDAVLDFMDRSHNSWETFTCQQFFQYHRDEIRSFSSAGNVRRRLSRTGNPYGPSLAANF